MMRLVTVAGQQELLLPGDMSVDIDNPGFQTDAIPGIWSLPVDLPWARQNLVGLNFPHLYRGPGGPPPVPWTTTSTRCAGAAASWCT
jgi:hypothetical protein